MLATTVSIPIEWILGSLLTLAGVISTLAGIIYNLMKVRLEAQDKIIEELKQEIKKLKSGCGNNNCIWRNQ